MTENELNELKRIIGRDLQVKLKKRESDDYGTITFDWEFNYRLRRRAFHVTDEYRTNGLSTEKGRYTLIYSQNNEDRIYINVHNYVTYSKQVFLNSKESKITDFDFMYAWDDVESKLIVIWEYERELGKCKMNRDFAIFYLEDQYNNYNEHSDIIFLDQ